MMELREQFEEREREIKSEMEKKGEEKKEIVAERERKRERTLVVTRLAENIGLEQVKKIIVGWKLVTDEEMKGIEMAEKTTSSGKKIIYMTVMNRETAQMILRRKGGPECRKMIPVFIDWDRTWAERNTQRVNFLARVGRRDEMR